MAGHAWLSTRCQFPLYLIELQFLALGEVVEEFLVIVDAYFQGLEFFKMNGSVCGRDLFPVDYFSLFHPLVALR